MGRLTALAVAALALGGVDATLQLRRVGRQVVVIEGRDGRRPAQVVDLAGDARRGIGLRALAVGDVGGHVRHGGVVGRGVVARALRLTRLAEAGVLGVSTSIQVTLHGTQAHLPLTEETQAFAGRLGNHRCTAIGDGTDGLF